MIKQSSLAAIAIFFSMEAFAQSRAPLDLCCIHYQKNKKLFFSLLNTSDSLIRVSIPSVEQKKNYNMLQEFDVDKDTIKLWLRPRAEVKINIPSNVTYHIDGDLYCNRDIAAKDKLNFAIRLSSKGYQKINYIKVSLPDKSLLMARIKP